MGFFKRVFFVIWLREGWEGRLERGWGRVGDGLGKGWRGGWVRVGDGLGKSLGGLGLLYFKNG